ncbi:hypothetical protein [Paenibacillus periandrae]|uniref:hypothetical protein n=1 Tax=Paenibacillus periandrae TaxID=1761741 RepID=UPI001F09278D|nr:hypothetical protein [Paenibacillus periandrae]
MKSSMKVALVMESSNRMASAPAFEFYNGKRSRWINAALRFMEELRFPTEHIYFLSFHELRIISYDESVSFYPRSPVPDKKLQKLFAERILAFLTEKYPGAEVQLHVGKSITDCLVPLLEENRIQHYIFAEGKQLLKKAVLYEELIRQERSLQRMRDLKREKEKMIAITEYFTPYEADQLVTQFDTLAHKHGLVKHFSEIKHLLREYNQKLRAAQASKEEYEQSLDEKERIELQKFFGKMKGLADLFSDEHVKNRFSNTRTMGRLTTFLIKDGYVKQTANKLSEAMFRLQIALLKRMNPLPHQT